LLLSFSPLLFLDLRFFASVVKILIAPQGLASALGSLIYSFSAQPSDFCFACPLFFSCQNQSQFVLFLCSIRHLGKCFTAAADFHFPFGGLLISAQGLGHQFAQWPREQSAQSSLVLFLLSSAEQNTRSGISIASEPV
jgi:hypothetical protein